MKLVSFGCARDEIQALHNLDKGSLSPRYILSPWKPLRRITDPGGPWNSQDLQTILSLESYHVLILLATPLEAGVKNCNFLELPE